MEVGNTEEWSDLVHLQRLNEWLAETTNRLKTSGARYDRYIQQSEEFDREFWQSLAAIVAAGIANTLDHLDWLNAELDNWETHCGY